MKIKKNLLFSIIIFSLFSSLFVVNSIGLSNINYTFDNNVIFDSDITSYKDPYNLKYQQEYTEIYNATYTFTNDIVGSIPNDWFSVGGINTVGVIDNFNGHNKVLELIDNNNSETLIIRNTIITPTNDTIFEMWLTKNSTNSNTNYEVNLIEVSTTVITITLKENDLKYFSGSELTIKNNFIVANNWFHLRIHLNDSFNTFDVYINGILEGNNLNYRNPSTLNGITIFDIRTNSADFGYTCYFDGLGYTIGENFDFEGDLIGSEPLLWNVQSFGTGIATVERFQESNVLKIFDDSIHESVSVSTTFTQLSNQSIEWYIAINDTSLLSAYNIHLTEGGSGRITLIIDNNDLDYHGGVIQTSVKDDFIVENVWFKITIILHDYTNTFDIYIDDILEGNNLNYSSSSTISIDRFLFASDGVQTSTTYLDNFDINSTNFKSYYIGLNLLPYLNTSQTLMEVDKYEFAINDIHTFNEVGSSNPNGWTDIEDPSGNKVGVVSEFDGSYDRLVIVDTNVIEDFRGIVRDNFGINGNFITITWGFFVAIFDSNNNTDSFGIQVESSDSTLILNCKILGNLSVVFGGSNPSIFTNVFRDVVLGQSNRYDFNFLLNYELDIIFFTYSLNGIIQEIYNRPMSNTGKQGLKKVNTGTILNTANTIRFYTDYIGIYNNGKSQVEIASDFGIALLNIAIPWNYQNNNILSIIGNGSFHFSASDGLYYNGLPTFPIKDTFIYNNKIIIINAYDSFTTELVSAQIVLTVSSNNFNFSYLKIDGVLFNESSNSYNLIFEHSGVNIDESFFYTDNNNKLQFNHISNDTNTEFIQARFNINDSTSTEASISFRSLINNNAKGFFRVNYTTTSDFIPFPVVQSTTSIFLTQGKNIRDFLIIITDLDDNNVNGLTSGFIDNIKLVFLGNIQISVITLSLIGMIVPLIIILTPTVALRDLYGESFVIPIFLLMSLILTIGQIIPIWLFFIIAISSSLFLIKENIQKDD